MAVACGVGRGHNSLMDLSKLPKLSGEKKPDEQHAAAGSTPEPTAQFEYRAAPPDRGLIGVGEVWLSIAVGTILMYVSWGFAQWLLATLTGQAHDSGFDWTTGEKAGQPVPYWEIRGHYALSEAAIFLFGLAMVAEAGALFAAGRWPRLAKPLIGASLLVCAAMTIYNAIVMVLLMRDQSVPIVSMFAVAYGGYAVISQWGMLRRLLA